MKLCKSLRMLVLLVIFLVFVFQTSNAAECKSQKKVCNGEAECDDFSDEAGCSKLGEYARMGLNNGTRIYLPSPSSNHTMCFYTFGTASLFSGRTSLTDDVEPSSIQITQKGHFCLLCQNNSIETYIYNTTLKSFEKVDSTAVNFQVQVWGIEATTTVKNIIIYRKPLSPSDMLQYYISQCGQNVNLDPTEVFLDHHLAVVLNKDYREQFLVNKSEDNWVQSHEYDIPITQKLSDSEDIGGIDYEVLTDMCEESVIPYGSLNLVTNHICNNGITILNHCQSDSRCNIDDEAEKKLECEYYNSNTVALERNGNVESCTRSEILNKHNNNLGLIAIESANVFLNCSKSSCITKAYAQDLMQQSTNIWASDMSMDYSAWTSKVETNQADRPVVLNKNGSWSLENSLPESSPVLCRVASASDRESKTLIFKSASDYSRLTISKAKGLDKLTMCAAVMGSGVLLQYSGVSSLTGKDLYIATEIINLDMYLVVYIAGFPEYFDFAYVRETVSSSTYICIRWEKTTGMIDLAIDGTWIVGKNTYANSRKISIPKTGTLVVGAGINTSNGIMQVDTDTGRWNGMIHNLVIWEEFFSPSILLKTSKENICTSRTKSGNGWLTFEEVIAGSTSHSMYSGFEQATSCGSEYEDDYLKRKRQNTDPKTTTITVSIDYTAYTLDQTSDISTWMKSTGGEVTVSVPEGSGYSVRQYNNQGNIKLDHFSELCVQGTWLQDTSSYTVEIIAYSTGLTILQAGQKTVTVNSGSPGKGTLEKVYPVGNKICFTNVMSSSDYVPLDGYIESISLQPSLEDAAICKSEETASEEFGTLIWPPATKSGIVHATCPYGKKGDYTKIGLASRSCGETGLSGEGNTTLCAVKYTIPIKESEVYFRDTNITEENVEEFTYTIKQMVEETNIVTENQTIAAAAALNKLTETSNVTITNTTLKTVIEVANIINLHSSVQIEDRQENSAVPAIEIVESVEKLAARVNVTANETLVVVTDTVSVAVYKPPDSAPSTLNDITAYFIPLDYGTDIDVSTQELEPLRITENNRILIRKELVEPGESVWFTSYMGNSSLFFSVTSSEVYGEIIGAGIGQQTKTFDDGKQVLMTFFTEDNLEKQNAMCQYWDMSGKQGEWSSRGMKFVNKTDISITCQSSHLTNFAILINPSNDMFEGSEMITLKVITITGTVISIISLSATIVGLIVFKQIRSVLTNRVHIGLSISLLIAYLALLIGPERVDDEGICYFFSIMTHFCFLCAFCWMFCEALNLYLRLVVVFDSYSNMFSKYTLFSLAVPVLIVLTTVIVEFAGEGGAYIIYSKTSGMRVYCWLDYKARMLALMLPLTLILCANLTVFVIVMKVLLRRKQTLASAKRADWMKKLRSAIAVSTLVGLSWILGVFALGEASFAVNVVFALSSSLQGVLIFYLYCFSKKEVFTRWRTTIMSSLDISSTEGQSEGSSPSAPMHREAQNELKKSNLNTILLPKTADDYPIIDQFGHCKETKLDPPVKPRNRETIAERAELNKSEIPTTDSEISQPTLEGIREPLESSMLDSLQSSTSEIKVVDNAKGKVENMLPSNIDPEARIEILTSCSSPVKKEASLDLEQYPVGPDSITLQVDHNEEFVNRHKTPNESPLTDRIKPFGLIKDDLLTTHSDVLHDILDEITSIELDKNTDKHVIFNELPAIDIVNGLSEVENFSSSPDFLKNDSPEEREEEMATIFFLNLGGTSL